MGFNNKSNGTERPTREVTPTFQGEVSLTQEIRKWLPSEIQHYLDNLLECDIYTEGHEVHIRPLKVLGDTQRERTALSAIERAIMDILGWPAFLNDGNCYREMSVRETGAHVILTVNVTSILQHEREAMQEHLRDRLRNRRE